MLPLLVSLHRAVAAPEVEPPYVPGVVMVSPREGHTLEALARAHGVRVAREVGPSGWGALTVPDDAAVLRALAADPGVRAASAMGRTYGTGGNAIPLPEGLPRERVPRWHLDMLGVDLSPPLPAPATGIVVAVLDTGVAWRDHPRGRRAPGLEGVRFVAPADFIELDGLPDDDHQHGTHVASLIAGRGSGAGHRGVAPTVSLMPVKVLDHDDVGTELALVDGIHHAVANGAHVVNMSLSFGPGYAPGPALVEALERADHAGVLLVAAAGNEAGEEVTQPAASPLVLAVGAIRPTRDGVPAVAPYSNTSPRVDVSAPGGALDADADGDGILDGIPAETIGLRDPARTGLWMYAGTSQAAALVSGVAARLMARGHDGLGLDARRARLAILRGVLRDPMGPAWLAGHGSGVVSWPRARAAGLRPDVATRRPCAALLAWVQPGARGLVRPALRVTVLDEASRPVAGVPVYGHLMGTGGGAWECVTDGAGTCRLNGRWRAPHVDDAWTWHVDTVVLEGVGWHPGAGMYASAGLASLLGGLLADARMRGAALAFAWRDDALPEVGATVAAVATVDLDVHRARAAWAHVALPGVLDRTVTLATGSLVMSTATAGHAPTVRAEDGGGPWIWRLFRAGGRPVVLLDAWAMRHSVVGVTAPGVHGGLGTGLRPVRVGTGMVPGPVAENRRNGIDLSGTALGEWLDAGGGRAEPLP